MELSFVELLLAKLCVALMTHVSVGVVGLACYWLVTFGEGVRSLARLLATSSCFCLPTSLSASTQEECILMTLNVWTLRVQTFKLFRCCWIWGSTKVCKISILSNIWWSVWMRQVTLSNKAGSWFLTGVLQISMLDRSHLTCSESYALTPSTGCWIILLLIIIVSCTCSMRPWLIPRRELLILDVWALLLTIICAWKLFLQLILILPSWLL